MASEQERLRRGETSGKNWQDKLRLMDAIDSLRDPGRPANIIPIPSLELEDATRLQDRLRTYEQTCAMLEHEVQMLEQQTLAALSEAGRLRRELDRREAWKNQEHDSTDRLVLQRRVEDSENERNLLLDALNNSEAELARMVKTLDLVVRKLQVA
jgi:hypothetical protein